MLSIIAQWIAFSIALHACSAHLYIAVTIIPSILDIVADFVTNSIA
jgi:hypothetical protein